MGMISKFVREARISRKKGCVARALSELFGKDVKALEQQERDGILESGKNVVSLVNELATKEGMDLKDSVTTSEDDGTNKFQVTLTIDGEEIIGPKCASKKYAKEEAAKEALVRVFGFDKGRVNDKTIAAVMTKAEVKKTPMAILHEMLTGRDGSIKLETTCSESPDSTPTNRLYAATLKVNEQYFEGTDGSKKLAKQAAAAKALQKMFNVTMPAAEPKQPANQHIGYGSYGYGLQQQFWQPNMMDTSGMMVAPTSGHKASAIADHIASVVQNKYDQISSESPHRDPAVMAAFVVTTGTGKEEAFIVSIATGTKCINGGKLSMEGRAIHDCHAEVLARRGLMLFFYKQLGLVLTDPTDSVFAESPTGGYKLKDTVKVHLYISSPPCGDARVYSNSGNEKKVNVKNAGCLRVKLESGAGTIPINSENVDQNLSWDGVAAGHQRTLSMSCSDKVLKWNCIGLQGALLSHYVHPIYLDTIVIGSSFVETHINRACWQRAVNCNLQMDHPFSVAAPLIAAVSQPAPRETKKPPEIATNWTAVTPAVEPIEQDAGLNVVGQSSRLAKRSLFADFLEIYHRVKTIVPHEPLTYPSTYAEAKKASVQYQAAKTALRGALAAANLGKWVSKPPETEQFEVYIQGNVAPTFTSFE